MITIRIGDNILNKSKTANLIYNRRRELGLTQFDVAKKIGYKHGNFIGMVEKGQSFFPVEKWKKYARALGVEEKQFLRVVLEDFYPDMLKFLKE